VSPGGRLPSGTLASCDVHGSSDRLEVDELAIRFTLGSIFRIQVPVDKFAYGVMLVTRPYMAFYSDVPAGVESGRRGFDGESLFVVAVHKSAYSDGRWGSPIFRVARDFLPPVPLFFRQDVINLENCEIVDHEGSTRQAEPTECVGLERSAVWSAEHVETRLLDHYEGRKNAFLASMDVKL
jgi:hypothetical protein